MLTVCARINSYKATRQTLLEAPLILCCSLNSFAPIYRFTYLQGMRNRQPLKLDNRQGECREVDFVSD